MENKPILSIITPTYNRASLLPRCYESLRGQSCMDFEWIIVDDGSTDDTQSVAKTFRDDLFPVTYVKKENGGKHTALNASHPHIHGAYVLILDSDDYLTADAVKKVLSGWAQYEDQETIGIVTFLKSDPKGNIMATVDTPHIPLDILRHKRRVLHINDCCEVIRTELFRKYPFPEFPGERFLSECALWNRVAQTHKCVYINEIIYICEYLSGGLTDGGRALRIRNPRGGMFISNLRMVRKNYLSQRVKYGLLYTCYGFFAGLTPAQMAKACCAKGLMWLCIPFGWMLYQYWKKKYC